MNWTELFGWCLFIMLPATLFIASLTLPWIAKSSAPVCIPFAEGYQFDTFATIYKSFCRDLSKQGFTVSQEASGVPVDSLSFVPTTKANRCDQVTCLSTFGTLIQPCKHQCFVRLDIPLSWPDFIRLCEQLLSVGNRQFRCRMRKV
jgi:hypothetical protein